MAASNEMKHYLVVALDMDQSAPGIVFKTLVRSLSSSCRLTLLAQGVDESLLTEQVRCLPLKGGVQKWSRAERRWKRYGCNPHDIVWAWKAWLKYRKAILQDRYDAVVTLTSNGYYASLNLGKIVSEKLACKYIIYSVDGMPSPLPWLYGNERLHRNISRELRRLCGGVDIFVLSNPQMTAYQQSILPERRGKWDDLFTPYRLLDPSFARKPHDGYNILYAGSLYGLRKIDGLLAAFRRFLEERPDATLCFVGATAPSYKQEAPDLVAAGKLVFKDHTDRIDDYYQVADCLVDIAADIPDDVFLSSKVICYLPYEIPILAVSGARSPVSLIMGGVPSIAQCGNDAEEILCALRRLGDVHDFSDRKALLEAFHPDTVCRKFKAILEA